jgi:acyl carrier protein
MKKQDFLAALGDIFQRDESCAEEDSLNEYEEWDSLSKMAVMAYFGKNFGIQMTLNQLNALKSVSDLIRLAGANIQ